MRRSTFTSLMYREVSMRHKGAEPSEGKEELMLSSIRGSFRKSNAATGPTSRHGSGTSPKYIASWYEASWKQKTERQLICNNVSKNGSFPVALVIRYWGSMQSESWSHVVSLLSSETRCASEHKIQEKRAEPAKAGVRGLTQTAAHGLAWPALSSPCL